MNDAHTKSYLTSAKGADPVEIAEAIDLLAATITRDGNRDIFGPWAVFRLAAKLGVTVTVSSSTDPAEVVGDMGEGFVGAVSAALDNVPPCEVADVLRAAMGVIQQVVEEVRLRGLAG